ncbi:MAG: phosphonate ABC transporter, permease protein PhnE [Erysipelotrichaceae bacterium]|nr:phosphonate ABC transporter, permease protein PhnE [Erysipelotrichaceae bacterium]
MNNNIQAQYSKYPKSWPKFVITIAAIVVLYLLGAVTLNFDGVNEKGIAIVINAFTGLFTPSLSVILDTSKIGLAYMLFETLAIAFLGTIIGLLFAVPFGCLASRSICPKWVNNIVLSIVSIIRAFPSLVLGIMFVKSVGPGAHAGVLAMAVGSIGMLSKLIVEAIEDLNPGIIEALDAAGCSPFEKIRYGIIPQLSSNLVSIILYRLDINLKNASILGIVQAGGIGAQLSFAIGARRWHDAGAMLLGIIVLTVIIEYISTRIRTKLATGDN